MTEEGGKSEGGRTIFTRLADAGEEAIQRVGEMPGVGKIAEPIIGLRERVDELQRRVRGIDALERRLTDVERRVSRLEGDVSSAGSAATSVQAQDTASGGARGGTASPANDPTGGTAGSEETGTSSQAP